MGRHDVHIPMFVFHLFSQPHNGAVCLTPAPRANIDPTSRRIRPKFSSFRGEFPEKLIDNPVWVWFPEDQMMSNLHRRPEAGRRP